MKKFLPKEEGYVDFRHLTPSSKKGKTEKKVFFGNLANDLPFKPFSRKTH